MNCKPNYEDIDHCVCDEPQTLASQPLNNLLSLVRDNVTKRKKAVLGTTRKCAPELVCPDCGEYPLHLEKGEYPLRVLIKCNFCIYEDSF